MQQAAKPSGLILVPIAVLHFVALAVCGSEAIALLLATELCIVGTWTSIGWLQARLRRASALAVRRIAVPAAR